jgi:hypothetical protein
MIILCHISALGRVIGQSKHSSSLKRNVYALLPALKWNVIWYRHSVVVINSPTSNRKKTTAHMLCCHMENFVQQHQNYRRSRQERNVSHKSICFMCRKTYNQLFRAEWKLHDTLHIVTCRLAACWNFPFLIRDDIWWCLFLDTSVSHILWWE